MSDKNADATQADADADAQSQADTITTETQAESEETISLEKAKELRSEAANLRKRLKDAETKAQAAEKATKDREDTEAKEQGKWAEIAKKREDELNELTKKLAERDLSDLKRSVAAKNGLPDDLIDRLHGDTEEELSEDALKLAKLVKTREAPDTDADRRTTPGKPNAKQGDTLTSYEFGKRSF